MPLFTRRWNDPREPDDGQRLLVCRYRPRALPKTQETWDAWMPSLGPSRELHADRYGKNGAPIGWREFRARYLGEMRSQRPLIGSLAARLRAGDNLTLLCSRHCQDERRCHRSLLRGLVEQAVAR